MKNKNSFNNNHNFYTLKSPVTVKIEPGSPLVGYILSILGVLVSDDLKKSILFANKKYSYVLKINLFLL